MVQVYNLWNGFRSYLKSILEVTPMNKRFFKLITLSISFFVFSSGTIKVKAIPSTLIAKPVVFVNEAMANPSCSIEGKQILELDVLKEQTRKLNEEMLKGISNSKKCFKYSKACEALKSKFWRVAREIAKELGACAAISYFCDSYIDPQYEITDEIVDRLNKEYLILRAIKKGEIGINELSLKDGVNLKQ